MRPWTGATSPVGGSEDGAAFDRLAGSTFRERSPERRALLRRPEFRQAGEGEWRAVPDPEQPGLADPAFSPPLVEAVGRDQAVPRPLGSAERHFSAAVSDRALISRWPIAESFAQAGISPQRSMLRHRPPSATPATAMVWPGAT